MDATARIIQGRSAEVNNEERLMKIMKIYEAKLAELLGRDAFADFVVATAKDMFREEVQGMADGGFKQFCADNFDAITGTDDEWAEFCAAKREVTCDT